MKKFDYEVALNKLNVGKSKKINDVSYDLIPSWVQGKDFLNLFLPYLTIVGDSREQDNWIENACKFYGINFELAKKDKKNKTENLKEGDYSFKVNFENKSYNYIGVVAYERKGSLSELYNNCLDDRTRVNNEFERFKEKDYSKIVLMLEVGDRLIDLINAQFSFRGKNGVILTKNVGYTIFSTIMSWKQPNNKNFDLIQSSSHKKLFWIFLLDCFYYFRNEIRKECDENNLIEVE